MRGLKGSGAGPRIIRTASLLAPRQHGKQLQEEYGHDSTNDSNNGFCGHRLPPIYWLRCTASFIGSSFCGEIGTDEPKSRWQKNKPSRSSEASCYLSALLSWRRAALLAPSTGGALNPSGGLLGRREASFQASS